VNDVGRDEPGPPHPGVVVARLGAPHAAAVARSFSDLWGKGLDVRLVARGRLFRKYVTTFLEPGSWRNGILSYRKYVRDLWAVVLGTPYVELTKYEPDLWEFHDQLVRSVRPHGPRRNVLVAQGQEMPNAFYELLRLVGVQATVLVDAEASVGAYGSTAGEIARILGAPLTTDLERSGLTTELHEFAVSLSQFATHGLPPPPERSGPVPVLVGHETLADEVAMIGETANAATRERLAVLLPRAELVNTYRSLLSHTTSVPVRWYLSTADAPQGQQVDFSKPGITVATYASARGLLFDTVFMPALNFVNADSRSSGWYDSLLACAVTSKRRLVLSWHGSGTPTLVTALPRHVLDVRTAPLPRGALDHPGPGTEQPAEPETAVYTRPERLGSSSAVTTARALLRRDRDYPRSRQRVLVPDEEVGLATLMRGPEVSLSEDLPKGFRSLADPLGEPAAAFDAFVTHNVRLVHSVALRHRGAGLDDEDLVQHGLFGLMRAVEKFDASFGTKFSTYAVNWIKQSIQRAIANEGSVIRIPVHQHEAVHRVRVARNRLVAEHGVATLDTLADACGLSTERVAECLRLAQGVLSLDAPVSDDTEATYADLHFEGSAQEPDEVHDREDVSALVRLALATLRPREETILRLRFGFETDEGLTLQEIGDRLGVTRERVRQIEAKAKRNVAAELSRGGVRAKSHSPSPASTASRDAHLSRLAEFARIRRTNGDLASGDATGLPNAGFGDPTDFAEIVRRLIDLALDSDARTVRIRVSPRGEHPWLALVHDGASKAGEALRSWLCPPDPSGLRPNSDSSGIDQVIPALARTFDEITVWENADSASRRTCTSLTQARRTGSWWLAEVKGPPPTWVHSTGTDPGTTVLLLRRPRPANRMAESAKTLQVLRHEFGLSLSERLRGGRLALALDDVPVGRRDPFLVHNPASQDLGTELVAVDGHKAIVTPRVLPHPAALSASDRDSVGGVVEWSRLQGFYVLCADRFVSCGGWLELDGMQSLPGTALARVVVEIESTELAAWGLGRPGAAPTAPEPLRARLTALATIARRRSEKVTALRPIEPLLLESAD